ncbi:hypothetical protein J3B02_002881 [Coemansia erecta]|uniref:Uncharacterized protein n=1 Tax=Coemansia asiatica TaxID=1052880 RepID=A0A9W7XPS1_9FUNG|nr:hypothetical protein LPJ64_001051 [Coemansia asiatica]KAJ2854014.1 hypothetical protein J3B02_002881 [Coemansia erecta]KAJ2882566.1 hypothetical protein FB639_002361 [Coemansia asiatica]
MSLQITRSKWRTLYRELVRAAPGAVSGKLKPTRVILAKIRQGFEQNKCMELSNDGLLSLYERGYNTLGFLKLARELESVERKLVTTIITMQEKRRIAKLKPLAHKRMLMPLQKAVHDREYADYESLISNIERDLCIILPRDQVAPSLDWIPRLKNLHK